jgi:hypothetical protein
MRHTSIPYAAVVLSTAALFACDQSAPLEPELVPANQTPEMDRVHAQTLPPELCALSRGDFTLASVNDFFPLGVGSHWLFRGRENGTRMELRINVLNETEVVGGVTTRVIQEREWENGELIEVSRNFFAATSEGAVCYLGEEVDIYEDGQIVSHEGAWRADAPGNRPGIFMPASPRRGMSFQMEGAPGIAEDAGEVVNVGRRVRVPAGSFRETVRIQETNPLDGSSGFKVFADDVGLIVDGPLSLVRYRVTGSDERDGDDD